MILVVEDDDDIRDIAVRVLTDEGFKVHEARNAVEALETLKKEDEIRLLFTDVVMPGGIDGWELARQAKTIQPNLHVIFTTGFAKQPGTADLLAGPLLRKPWRHEQLVAHVRRALDIC